MDRLVVLLSALGLAACSAQTPLQTLELPAALELRLSEAVDVVESLALDRVVLGEPGPWAPVSDIAFLAGGSGELASGPLVFTWSLHSRNLGLTEPVLTEHLEAATAALGRLDLPACEPAHIEVFEVETALANQDDRFNLAREPGAEEVLVGVYDPRSLTPAQAAIVLTPVTPAELGPLVAHELAHHAFEACGLDGDSEAFAELVEGLVRPEPQLTPSRDPVRVAAADPPAALAPARVPPRGYRSVPPRARRARARRLYRGW